MEKENRQKAGEYSSDEEAEWDENYDKKNKEKKAWEVEGAWDDFDEIFRKRNEIVIDDDDDIPDPNHPELQPPVNDKTPFPAILSKYNNPIQVLVNNGIPIMVQDLNKLVAPNWLNDAVISDYFRILSNTREAKRQNSFFIDVLSLSFLLDKRTKLKSTYMKYFDYDTLYLPLNIGNFHWTLLIIKPMEQKVYYLDSFFGKNDKKINQITNALTHYANLFNVSLPKKKWTIIYKTNKEILGQKNGYDCGVFVCLYAYRDLMGLPLLFSLNKKPLNFIALVYRNAIANSILQNKIVEPSF